MRAGLTVGLVALSILAAAEPAEARGRRGGIVFVAGRNHAAPAETSAARIPGQEPWMRTAAADAGAPEPMTTGTAVPVVRREMNPPPNPTPVPARPWCITGRVFGSGAGFCAIN
ncbi:hypothetical protein [Methylobacterium frigidaeris]|uniref:Uncharacterized protein n=1 Tax=Methylobacterium frigidaeris TaxID=2038277 RepID=A0AA37H6T1_9HYPH|nr:hypothetical protein [Methylobacterium frigidaeris]PIK68488.1 hypothetical protein CS379_34785 [Methylobacterium frigidaeris]GJD59940.1 hypothetical protein MPEAHAMD_0071 [Methylobacterium frigidaeris]